MHLRLTLAMALGFALGCTGIKEKLMGGDDAPPEPPPVVHEDDVAPPPAEADQTDQADQAEEPKKREREYHAIHTSLEVPKGKRTTIHDTAEANAKAEARRQGYPNIKGLKVENVHCGDDTCTADVNATAWRYKAQ